MRILLIVIGLVALAMGLLWIGQGTGYVMWPRESFMLRQIDWAWYGAALAFFGFVIVMLGARKR